MDALGADHGVPFGKRTDYALTQGLGHEFSSYDFAFNRPGQLETAHGTGVVVVGGGPDAEALRPATTVPHGQNSRFRTSTATAERGGHTSRFKAGFHRRNNGMSRVAGRHHRAAPHLSTGPFPAPPLPPFPSRHQGGRPADGARGDQGGGGLDPR